MLGEKEFRTAVRLDKAINERMPRRKKNTAETRRLHDDIKRTRDELARKLDK